MSYDNNEPFVQFMKNKNIKITVTNQSGLERIIVTEYSDLNHLLNLKLKELMFLRYFLRLGTCSQC